MRALPDFLHSLGRFPPHALQHDGVLPQGPPERRELTADSIGRCNI